MSGLMEVISQRPIPIKPKEELSYTLYLNGFRLRRNRFLLENL